jgi:hypothetical protein
MTLVTSDNRGPLVNVAMWIALACTLSTAGVKLYTKWTVTKRFQLDDYLMILTAVSIRLFRWHNRRMKMCYSDQSDSSALLSVSR